MRYNPESLPASPSGVWQVPAKAAGAAEFGNTARETHACSRLSCACNEMVLVIYTTATLCSSTSDSWGPKLACKKTHRARLSPSRLISTVRYTRGSTDNDR
ncbi:unnamed protein product, partial [Ectocarpus sp. 12 AP-2014]